MAKAVSKNDPNKRKASGGVKKKMYKGREVVPVLYICRDKGSKKKYIGAQYVPKLEPVEDEYGDPIRWDLI